MKDTLSTIFAFSLVMLISVTARGVTVADPNILNTGTASASATANSSYPGFSASSTDDLGGSQFFFGDYNRGGGSNTTINDQILSFSNLATPTGINSLRFFDGQEFEVGRVATQVTVYASSAVQTGAAALDPTNFTLVGSYLLPIGSNGFYTEGPSSDANGNYGFYDTVNNLGIAAGTQSILLDFGAEHDVNGGPTYTGTPTSNEYNVGAGFTEIQAFGGVAAPEPSTYIMMLGALALLGFVVHRSRIRL